MGIVMPVETIAVADGIGMHEAAQGWRVPAGLEVVEPNLGEPGLPGVLEAADVVDARNAELVIGVDAQHVAARVGHRNDRAALVRLQEAAIRGA